MQLVLESLESRSLASAFSLWGAPGIDHNVSNCQVHPPCQTPIYNPPHYQNCFPPAPYQPVYQPISYQPPAPCQPPVPCQPTYHSQPDLPSIDAANGQVKITDGFNKVLIDHTTVGIYGQNQCQPIAEVWYGDPHVLDLVHGTNTPATSNVLVQPLSNMTVVGFAGAANTPLLDTVVFGNSGWNVVVDNSTGEIASLHI